MEILFSLVILVLVIVVLCAAMIIERRDHAKQISELTSKLMSQSFSEYSFYNNGQRAVDKRKGSNDNAVPKPVADPVLGTNY
jgi:outer membrane lipoprotein-sorting protein